MAANPRQRRPTQSHLKPLSRVQTRESMIPAPKKPTRVFHPLPTWSELPAWSRDNAYIHTGYRPLSTSYTTSIWSCFYIHNETGNIYSHLLATLWMLILSILYYSYAKQHYPDAGTDDWVLFGMFFLGGGICFELSTVYHVFSNHSRAVHDVYHRLDLLGISAVTAGCFPPGLWYSFPCLARRRKMFWIGLDLAAQISAAFFVLFVRRVRKPAWRSVRGILFSFMASSAFYPIIYACFVHGYRQMDIEAGATRYAVTVLVYLSAATIYGTRIPEAWRPGRFDTWGHSHQIFHVLMAVGLTVHFSAFAKAFDYAQSVKRC